ncbi:MAG: AAA family ATPase [Prevotellaceae bacterium]|nr:AAA family ATPase [Prevotellaceae bacterium]
MTFNDVIGQHEVKARLQKMIDENRIPHAILLCGPRGAGKLSLAMAFAEMLCQSPLDRHCSYPVIRTPNMTSDHKAISADFADEWREMLEQTTYFSINDWLEAMGATSQQAIITVGESDELIRKLSLRPSQGNYKTSIIWLPERMNSECANKLLKLLEEPPTDTVFLLVSEEPEALLETIRSRTQRIDVKKIKTDDIRDALISQRGLDSENANLIARIANGNWLKAIEMLNAENENAQFLELFISLMRLCYKRDVRELKKWSDNVAGLGREKQLRLLNYTQRMVRENFIFNFRQPELNYMTMEEMNFARNFARFINEANVAEINSLLDTCQRDIAQNANAKIVFFDFTLKMIILLIKK